MSNPRTETPRDATLHPRTGAATPERATRRGAPEEGGIDRPVSPLEAPGRWGVRPLKNPARSPLSP